MSTGELALAALICVIGVVIAWWRRPRRHDITVEYERVWDGPESPGEWVWWCGTCQVGEGEYSHKDDAWADAWAHDPDIWRAS